jgi:glutathione S-transferase
VVGEIRGSVSGVRPEWLAATVWTFAIARLIHMVLYYAISTERNPSPRSYFYMIALLSNVVLMVIVAIHLASWTLCVRGFWVGGVK